MFAGLEESNYALCVAVKPVKSSSAFFCVAEMLSLWLASSSPRKAGLHTSHHSLPTCWADTLRYMTEYSLGAEPASTVSCWRGVWSDILGSVFIKGEVKVKKGVYVRASLCKHTQRVVFNLINRIIANKLSTKLPNRTFFCREESTCLFRLLSHYVK